MPKKVKPTTIGSYIREQSPKNAAICRVLKREIEAKLLKAESKLYHGSPVWFIGENAVVGFSVTTKDIVKLLFWNGQSLSEPELAPVGKFKAAEIKYLNKSEIDSKDLHRWLKKAGNNIWDLVKFQKGSL